MLKPTIILFISLTFAQTLLGQFKSLQKQIPTNFTILDTASGDINKDGVKDLVVIIRNDFEKYNTDTTRPVLLLQGNKSGQYKLIARNDSVVLCMGCGGIFGDPYQGITIKNGYFSIEHYGGSGWRWTRIITFKFDTNTKQFVLQRDAGFSWHVSDVNKQTEKLFGKSDFNKVSFTKYSNNKHW